MKLAALKKGIQMNKMNVAALLLATALWPGVSQAAVTLLDKDDWKIQMGGFIETDIFHDSARSLTEVPGATPIDRAGSVGKENGQTVFSIRNSRLAFTILPPVANDFKSKGYLEYDLLGYDPKPASTGTTNSESGYYSNPTLRVRHAYFSSERAGYTWLVGQTWSLFGWQPNYVLTTASVPPGPGILYQRTVQLMGMKSLEVGTAGRVQIAASLARPSQRDSERPNLDAGVRWSLPSLTSGFAASSGDVKLESLSVGLSGTWRQFVTPQDATATSSLNKHSSQALAVDLLVPVIPARDGSPANSLTLTAEASQGTGFADEFPGWTGNLPQFPTGAGATANLNLDAGQGGYDSTGFQLVQLRSFSTQLQYHLPGEMRTFATVGYAQLNAMQLGRLTAASGKVGYDQSSMAFVNVFHDCTKQIRTAIEYAKFSTHYTDGQTVGDERVQWTGYFRF